MFENDREEVHVMKYHGAVADDGVKLELETLEQALDTNNYTSSHALLSALLLSRIHTLAVIDLWQPHIHTIIHTEHYQSMK